VLAFSFKSVFNVSETCIWRVCCVCGLAEQFTHLAIWGSIAFWFLFLVVYPHFWPTIDLAPEMVGMVRIGSEFIFLIAMMMMMMMIMISTFTLIIIPLYKPACCYSCDATSEIVEHKENSCQRSRLGVPTFIQHIEPSKFHYTNDA